MDITKISDSVFKLKAKSGVAITDLSGPVIESLTGENIKSFTGPGEYEVAGISIIGVKIDDSNVFVYEVDDLRICHLGNISKKLPEAKISLLGDIDILLLPINDESIEITQQIENYYIIPYGYKSEDELAKFLKDSGLSVERMTKFSLKKEEIIEDSTVQIIVLDVKK